MMKKWLFSGVLIGSMVLLAACGSEVKDKATAKNSYEKLKQAGEITIGTEGTYSPFTFHDASGKLTGFDVEIAKEAFKRIGLKAKFVETKWDGMIAGLDAKRFDVVANEVGIRPDREEKYSFSDPYILSKAVIIVGKNNDSIAGFADLKGKKVASSATSNYHDIAVANGAEITTVEGFSQAIELVTSKRVDATLNDTLTYFELMKQRPELAVKVAYTESEAAKSAFLFRKGNAELIKKVNTALSEMKEDGTYLKISEKWFGTDVSK
jgi:cystine transport system substrate-binding protein